MFQGSLSNWNGDDTMKNKIMAIILITSLLLIVGCGQKNEGPISENKITVFKTEMCGCCVGYIAELEKYGFDVDVVNMDNLDPIKKKYNIPAQMQSCHTAVIGDYFVEGHVPIAVVQKLIEEKPDIDGIILPRMPAGSPGMPGLKTEPFEILSLSDGKYSEYMTI